MRLTTEPGFRSAFRRALVDVLGASSVALRLGDATVGTYPADAGFPAFGCRDADNPDGGEFVLTWRFTIPLEAEYPKSITAITVGSERVGPLVSGPLDVPLVKACGAALTFYVNWTLQ